MLKLSLIKFTYKVNSSKGSKTENMTKEIQSLNARQKLIFGMVCWGIPMLSRVKYYKENGYDQKYKDASRAMHTGQIIYGIGIILFGLFLIFR